MQLQNCSGWRTPQQGCYEKIETVATRGKAGRLRARLAQDMGRGRTKHEGIVTSVNKSTLLEQKDAIVKVALLPKKKHVACSVDMRA